MAPKPRPFVMKIIDGPSGMPFIKWILECQEEKPRPEYDMMYFTIEAKGIKYRLQIQVIGILNNNQRKSDFKILGIIRGFWALDHEHRPAKRPPKKSSLPLLERLADLIVAKDVPEVNIGLDKVVLVVTGTYYRHGKIYGPMSALALNVALAQPVTATVIDAQLVPNNVEILF